MKANKIKDHKSRVRRREMLVRWLIAGGVVFLVVISIAVFALKSNTKPTNEEPETAKEPAEEVQVTEEDSKDEIPKADGEPVEITISAAGDCTLGTDESFAYNTSFTAKYEEVGDPGYFFSNVKDIFSEDDLTIVNLEGTLTTETSRTDKTFAFKGDPEYVKILTEGSVEAVNLANNHSQDYSEKSYTDTIANVEAAGISSFGYERTQLMEIKGVKIGLAGVCELADGLDCKADMLEYIEALQEQGAQLIIVSFHWGTEKESWPDDIQKELAHTAIDAGAHLVLGHHPHVLQGIEKYNGRYICYSLGNFCFGGNKNPADKDTMVFQQKFTVYENKVSEDDEITIIPCSISSTADYNNYQPTPAENGEKERIINKIDKLAIE